MVFKVAQTWTDPSSPVGRMQGFPAPGTGQQSSGPVNLPPPDEVPWKAERPTKGLFSWLFPSQVNEAQRGSPDKGDPAQLRPPGSMPNVPPIFGGVGFKWMPYYDRGAEAYSPITGKVLYNPIGAGIVAMYRPQASYGPSGDYENGSIWWRSQLIPTSVELTELEMPEDLAEILGPVNVQAAVRTR